MILAILLFVAFTAGAIAFIKHANRPVNTGRGGTRGRSPRGGSANTPPKPSWLLRAWNASGAPETSETTLGGAAAVVTGKAAGAMARGSAWTARKLGSITRPSAQGGNEMTCAGCGQAIPPSEKHVAIARHIETERNGTVTVKDAEALAFYHERCEPKANQQPFAGHEPTTPVTSEPTRTPNPGKQDAMPSPVPQPRQEHNPMTIGSLYDAGDAVAAQKFEGVIAVERFLKAIAEGTQSVTSVWTRWAERLAGPLHVDESIVSHIRACTGRQTQIAELTGEGATYVTELLNGSTQQALENNREVPHHRLMESGGASPAVPEFYDRFRTSIVRAHEDIRGEVLLMAAVKDASDRQAAMFQSTAQRLEDSTDMNLQSIAPRYYAAAKIQRAISAEVEEAHVRFVALLQMTLRDLTNSNLKAPNANMVGVN